MLTFEIDPDIRRAKTLSTDFYTDKSCFDLSREKIFGRTWQFLGRSDDLAGLNPVTLLSGFIDEPLLVVRSGSVVNCISNVCTHRGKILIEEKCEAKLIRCEYHGRRYSLDGKFLSMPEFEGVEDFPCESDDLRNIPFAMCGGFMFASLDPAAPFNVFVGNAAELFQGVGLNRPTLASTREYEVNAHWALYCENYLEGFHIPYVHKALNELVDYGTYSTETFRYSSLQTAFDDSGEVAARYLFIFPNMMFNLYRWGVSVNIVRPVLPSRTIVEFLTYVTDESKLGEGAGADLHSVEMEDEAVVESVQRGIRSRFYSHGRYSPTREQGTHHFHRLIAEFME